VRTACSNWNANAIAYSSSDSDSDKKSDENSRGDVEFRTNDPSGVGDAVECGESGVAGMGDWSDCGEWIGDCGCLCGVCLVLFTEEEDDEGEAVVTEASVWASGGLLGNKIVFSDLFAK
jgi:hypothetical protein